MFRRRFHRQLLLLGMLSLWPASSPGENTSLLTNPTFARGGEGWLLRDASVIAGDGHGGSRIVRLEPPEDQVKGWSHVGIAISPVPIERKLVFTAHARAQQAGQAVGINAFAYDDQGEMLDNYIVKTALESTDWERISSTIVAPPETQKLTIWIINSTPHALLVSDAHLTEGEPAESAIRILSGPGVILATAATGVAAETSWRKTPGTVTFPIPLATEYQVPLTFELEIEPETSLRGYRWIEREDGTNLLAEVDIMPGRVATTVRWKALVLVDETPPRGLPPAERPEINDENRRWLRSTACVQSDDPQIVALAREMAEQDPDIAEYAHTVILFTSQNEGDPDEVFDTLDASKALRCGGSCTSRANLAAALLRAHGIPARTQAHLPTWSGPLYIHWLVEYWHPGVGWVWLESSQGKMQPATCSLVTINIANPEDEDLAFSDALKHSGVMQGAPYLAVHDISPELERAPTGAQNWAEVVTPLVGAAEEREELFQAARRHFASLSKRAAAGEVDSEGGDRIAEALSSATMRDLRVALE